MSKAFTKDDAAPALVIVAARAPLPAGLPNYVTPRGLGLLQKELAERQAERAQVDSGAAAGEPRVAIAAARLAELEARLGSAVVVNPATQPHDEVRFGAQVTVRTAAGERRLYRLVGVDEADVAHGLVAFVSPIARTLLGTRVGDVVMLRTPRGEEELEVVAIRYESE